MNIDRIESYFKDQVCVVKLTSEDDAIGFGQTAPFSADITQLVLHRQVAPIALGMADDDFSLYDTIFRSLHKFTGTYVCRAVSGIDTAMWDLKGRRESKSVTALLGGTRSYVGMYYSSMVRNCPVEWEVERIARLKAERGYKAFKLHVGKFNGEGEDYWPGRTEDMIRSAADTLKGDGDIYVDPNGAFTRDWALKLAPMMRECGVKILEEPLPFWKVKETADLRKEIASYGILTAGGEQDYNPNVWDMIFSLPMADIIQPDICYIGGFTRTLETAKRAAALGLYTTPHTSNRSMLLYFGLHLNASIEKPWVSLEHGVEEDKWTQEMFVEDLPVIDGKIKVPDGPGWGCRLSEDWLKSANYCETHKQKIF
jgi:L-alanine-DL-glutamate epimerase-like enolase superfamily enzyme